MPGGGSLDALRIGAELGRDRMSRYAHAKLAAWVSLMRHCLLLPRTPHALSGGVAERPAPRTLIARAGSAQALAARNARTLKRAVDLAVVAALTDAHLHAAALAVVEPVCRLLQRPQCPLPKHWTALGKAGIKGLQIRLPRRCAPRARGSTPIKRPGPSSI